MKIRIEISSGNVSCNLDTEVDMDMPPQDVFQEIEEIISSHEIHCDIVSCSFCDNFATPVQEEPCRTCMVGEHMYTGFTRSIW